VTTIVRGRTLARRKDLTRTLSLGNQQIEQHVESKHKHKAITKEKQLKHSRTKYNYKAKARL
jgi:hypothetical protein